MVSSGMLHCVALVRTDVLEELSASIRVTRICELVTMLAVTSNRCTLRRNSILVFFRSVRRLLVTASVVTSSLILVTLMKEVLGSSETSVRTRATRHIPEDTILPCYVVFSMSWHSLRSRYSQHSVFKHLQSLYQASHPFRTTGKIMVLYILIFVFLDSR
jgi:hypothetical protein